jgi:membrane-associated protease RseP (regulator of RpoE activity)
MTQTHRPDDAGVPAPPPPRQGWGAQRPARPDGESPNEEAAGRIGLVVILSALAALGIFSGWIYVWVILGIVVMIFLHELGHFLTAKWSGMKVTEFFISFGPRIWSFRRGETEYGLKAIPAGAYVRIVGMNNLDEADPADEPRTYRQQSFPKRLLVVSAGSIMHFIQAWVLLVLAIGVFGVPGGSITDRDQADVQAFEIGSVSSDTPASAAGFKDGDRIVAVDGEPVSSLEGGDDLSSVIRRYEVGDQVAFTVEREGHERTIDAELGPRPSDVPGGRPGSPFLGVTSGPFYANEAIGIGEAVLRSPGEMTRFVGDSVGAIADFFSPSGLDRYADQVGNGGTSSNQPSGGSSGNGDDGNRMLSIVGAVRLAADVSEQGIGTLLVFFFGINIFIGLLNMVPLPPLDGGHAAVAIYERIRSRRGRRYQVDMAKLLPLTYVVVMGLVLLGATAFYLDLVNPINL